MNNCPFCQSSRTHDDFAFIGGDSNKREDVSFNVYICYNCSIVFREDEWTGRGVWALGVDGSVVKVE